MLCINFSFIACSFFEFQNLWVFKKKKKACLVNSNVLQVLLFCNVNSKLLSHVHPINLYLLWKALHMSCVGFVSLNTLWCILTHKYVVCLAPLPHQMHGLCAQSKHVPTLLQWWLSSRGEHVVAQFVFGFVHQFLFFSIYDEIAFQGAHVSTTPWTYRDSGVLTNILMSCIISTSTKFNIVNDIFA